MAESILDLLHSMDAEVTRRAAIAVAHMAEWDWRSLTVRGEQLDALDAEDRAEADRLIARISRHSRSARCRLYISLVPRSEKVARTLDVAGIPAVIAC